MTTFRILEFLVGEWFASRPLEMQLYDVGPELVALLRQASSDTQQALLSIHGDSRSAKG